MEGAPQGLVGGGVASESVCVFPAMLALAVEPGRVLSVGWGAGQMAAFGDAGGG